jgi:hypothetical protein
MGGRWCSHLVEVELLDTFLMMIQSDSTSSATKFKRGCKISKCKQLAICRTKSDMSKNPTVYRMQYGACFMERLE